MATRLRQRKRTGSLKHETAQRANVVCNSGHCRVYRGADLDWLLCLECAMSVVTLLLVNAICSFVGASFGAFFGVRSWLHRNNVVVEKDEDDF